MSVPGLRRTLTVPNWLARRPGLENSFRVLYGIAAVFDVMLEGMKQGIAAAFPGYGPATDSLPLIGRNRGFIQGPSQSDDSYTAELRNWFVLWSLMGLDLTLCKLVLAYVPGATAVRVVNRANFWTSLRSDGTIERVTGTVVPVGVVTPFVYNANAILHWDNLSNPAHSGNWSDIWIIVEGASWAPETRTLSQIAAAYPTLAAWTAAQTGIGQAVSPTNAQQLVAVIKQAVSPHANAKCVIFSFGNNFNPTTGPTANGYCESWSFDSGGGSNVPQRPSTDRYWQLPFSRPMQGP